MPLIVLLALLLTSGWFCFEVLVAVPFQVLHFLGSFSWMCLGIALLALFSWLLGD